MFDYEAPIKIIMQEMQAQRENQVYLHELLNRKLLKYAYDAVIKGKKKDNG